MKNIKFIDFILASVMMAWVILADYFEIAKYIFPIVFGITYVFWNKYSVISHKLSDILENLEKQQ